jgi:hypothetical protein
VKKQNKIRKGYKNKAHNIRRMLYRKQAHQSHTPNYEKEIKFFVQLYSIINTNMFFFLELLFLSNKVMWVAIDCRSKNWVAVLKSLGSTGLDP